MTGTQPAPAMNASCEGCIEDCVVRGAPRLPAQSKSSSLATVRKYATIIARQLPFKQSRFSPFVLTERVWTGTGELRLPSVNLSRISYLIAAVLAAIAALLLIFPVATLVAIGALAAAGAGCIYYRLRASLPLLEGERVVEGLKLPIRIDRDAAGVPIVSGASRADVAFGLGFLHAQERLFQMDLSRRAGAGELAELFGKRFIDFDREARIHQFRQKAEKIVASIEGDQRALLMSYSAGVTAGMRALHEPPLEYMLLRTQPVDWQPSDTLLVLFHMYRSLQDNRADQDYNLYLLYGALPVSVADFLTPAGSADWDAPIIGEPSLPAKSPGSEIFDFHTMRPERVAQASPKTLQVRGSNAWAVSAQVSGTGHAIVANDIHLSFGMPPIFYRATLDFADPGGRRGLSGVTLPGFPFMVAGTNGDTAWGIANAEIDSVDLIRLDQTGLPPNAYHTTGGVAEIQTVREVIHVKGDVEEVLDIHMTPWVP
jgi:penicillin amidase